MRTRFCPTCLIYTPLRDNADGGPACATCARNRPPIERDCPTCGAPAGETCIAFSPRGRGRGSVRRLQHTHERRAAAR